MNDLIRMVVQFLVTGVSVVIVAAILPGMKVDRYGDAVGFAVVTAVLNVLAWRVFALFTWPMAVLTLGIGGFILNGVIFLVARRLVSGVKISGCFVAAIAALLVSVVNSALMHALRDVLR